MTPLMVTLSQVDETLLRAVVGRRRRLVDSAMRWITKLGNPGVIVPFTLVLGFGAVASLHDAGIVAAWSITLSHGVVRVLKPRFQRERPSLPIGLGFLIEPEDRFSFPSGHATAALSVGLPLFLALHGPLATLALAVAVLVGLSRCYLGVHYPGDVLMGWTIAAGTVWTVAAGFRITF